MMETRSDLIFDVGMHRGEDTAFYLAKGFRVVGFEANPDLVQHCKRRFEKEIGYERVVIVPGAIVAEPRGKVPFYANRKLTVWGTVSPDWALRNEQLGGESEKIEVEPVDISEAFQTFGVPLYLKIDIEGADRVVLEAVRRLPTPPQYLSIESEKARFRDLRAELQLLAALGYSKFKPVQQITVPGRTICTRTLIGEPTTYRFEEDASGPFGEEAPGPWLTRAQCLRAYINIFTVYRIFGDGALIHKSRKGRHIKRLMEAKVGHHLPGWYDTHAKL